MKPEEIEMIWLYLAQFWPTFEIPTEPRLVEIKMLAWHNLLGDVQVDMARRAVDSLSLTREFAPNPGQIRAHIEKMASDEMFQQICDSYLRPALPAASRGQGD